MSFSVRASLCALWVAVALTGCSEDEKDPMVIGGAAATGTGGVGMAGMMATGGTAGTMVTGGVGMAGMMATGGTGGMGMAGTMATGGTGGMAGGGGPEAGCEVAATGTPAELHDAALMAFNRSCGFGSCHDGSNGGTRANLAIPEGANLNMTLVDKPSCEAPAVPLVKSGGGDQALQGSWIWQKLTAPVSGLDLIAKPEWGTPSMMCGTTSAFGERMPQGGFEIPEDRLNAVRNWICAGAAGP